MGEDTIRYLLYVSGKWRWRPTKVCGSGGFRLGTFDRELTVQAKAWASALNAEWDRAAGARCTGGDVLFLTARRPAAPQCERSRPSRSKSWKRSAYLFYRGRWR